MQLIFFTHPNFIASQSMPRFAKMLLDYFTQEGYAIKVWTAKACLYHLGFNAASRKWFGYVDSFILFPLLVKIRLLFVSNNSLFVFTDQALGPWVPLVSKRKHVIHCHDFLALRSALGEIKENPTGKTGILYQKYIQRGFSKAKNFISVSKRTQADLQRFYKGDHIQISEVVYNGFNQPFGFIDKNIALQWVSENISNALSNGYILHVGGNQWYKNRVGVVEIFSYWKEMYPSNKKLLLVGKQPDRSLHDAIEKSLFKNEIIVCTTLADDGLNFVYSGAECLLFPSLAEGFGWPIAEAMAAGTTVITTDEAPMNEVGQQAAAYIQRMPASTQSAERTQWLMESSLVLETQMCIPEKEKQSLMQIGLVQAAEFDTIKSMTQIKDIYEMCFHVPDKHK